MTPAITEKAVLAVWSKELGVQIGPDDSFFRSGGDSLRAARATLTLARVLSREIELATLLRHPVARDYAEAVDALAQGAEYEPARLPIVTRDGSLPLSYQQEARLEREREARTKGRQAGPYYIPFIVAFDVHVDTKRADSAINLLVARHESLHTGFTIGASAAEHRAFAVPDARVTLDADEFGPLDVDAREALVAKTYVELVAGEMDFARVPLLRARLLHIGDDASVLVMAVEHLVMDGWSKGILFDELTAVLRGEQLPGLTAQYADWAAWHRARLRGPSLDRLLDYWRVRLAGTSPYPPLDLPSPAEPADDDCAELSHQLPAAHVARLERRATALDTTLFVILLTAFARAWQATTATADVVIHGATANRATAESHTMIGTFAHSLVFRIAAPLDTDSDTAIEAVRALVTEALQHQDIPLSLLTRHLQPQAHGRATQLPRLYLGRSTLKRMVGEVPGGTGEAIDLRHAARSAQPGLSAFYADDDAGNLMLQLVFRPDVVDWSFAADVFTAFVAELAENARE